MKEKIEDKYKSLTPEQHILLRPSMYIGSVVTEKCEKYIFNKNTGKFESKEVNFNAGFLKLFDEIISNSVDESKRPDSKLNTIKVFVSKSDNSITVFDNGGIPVEMHKIEKKYVPELCFASPMSGSNFNDNENREVVGTHGIGSSAVAIMSSEFKIETADGKNKFYQVYTNNLSEKSKPKISKTSKHFTKITYIPDFKIFGMSCIDDDTLKLIESRVFEIAGTNQNLKIYFNDENISIKSFFEYCKMFIDDESELLYTETEDKKWSVGISPCQNGFQNISFVNSVNTFMGGSHVEFVLNQFVPKIKETIKKKYKSDISTGQIKNKIFLFLNATVNNPKFSSQTKERLTSEYTSFVNPIKISDKFASQICKSELLNIISDWLDKKKMADDSKSEREANKTIAKVKVEKLVDCRWAGTLKKSKTSLSITEGDSAAAGFRKFRDPNSQALYPIRGKILNVRVSPKDKVRANEELKGIMAAMGLQFGKSPFIYRGTKVFQDNLRIHEIRIYSDQDSDGYQISGLLLNIFAYYWPELIKEHRVARVDTPILIAKQGRKSEKFYNKSDFDKWCEKNDQSKWDIEYFKGLGALDDCEYKEIVQNPNIYYYELDDCALDELEIWFGKDADKRKEKLLK